MTTGWRLRADKSTGSCYLYFVVNKSVNSSSDAGDVMNMDLRDLRLNVTWKVITVEQF